MNRELIHLDCISSYMSLASLQQEQSALIQILHNALHPVMKSQD